jgi:glycerol-3-phosphate cytidylyltransferase-like family protein
MGPLADFRVKPGHQKQNTLKWIDEVEKDRVNRGKEALKNNNYDDDLLKKPVIPKIDIHRNKSKEDVQRALRDRSFTMSQITGVKNYERINLYA